MCSVGRSGSWVDINLADVVMLGSLPDKVGLFGRRKDAAASRILQGRDSRSVRFLVPDVRGVDQNFHDVTIVDMDEERTEGDGWGFDSLA